MIAKTSAPRPRLRNRKGALLVFVAVSMVALVGMLAMTLDLGSGGRQRRIAQTAADAGAVAGATQIYRGMSSDAVNAAALDAATRNLFVASEITVTYPPATGTYAGNDQYVEVVVNRIIPTIFGSLFGMASLDIQARGVAGVAGASSNCVYSLASAGTGINIEGGLDTNCGVVANSTDDPAIYVKKSFDVPSVGAVGGIDGSPTGSVSTGIPPVPDPLATLAMPTDTDCDYTNTVVNGTVTLSEGVYCGGITINGQANLNPGTYFIRGGGITGGGISGTGVTLINSIGNGPSGLAAFRPITFPQSCTINLTAPTTGQYQGIVMVADPAGPSSPDPNAFNDLCGKDNNGQITGIIYFPNQTFNLGNGNGKLTITGGLIAKFIETTNGGARYNIVSDPSGNAALKVPVLVQ